MAVALLASSGATAAAAQQDRGSWFKSLRQPVTGASCCDISDCRQADAKWINKAPSKDWQWWAEVQGEWIPIPPEKVLKKRSIDGEAYVCSGYDRRIYCFVPPNMDY